MKYLDEIAALLHIHEKAIGHPQLKPIADAAMQRLREMAQEFAPPPAHEPPPQPEPETEDPSAEGSA